jgi:hypothetical protein
LTACSLGLEASAVAGLRTMKILAGGAVGEAEARRMVREKVEAGLSLQARALSGGLRPSPPAAVSKTLAHYRRPVRANLRRLTRS